jgi:Rrf2 family protein
MVAERPTTQTQGVHISSKADYAVRSVLVLATVDDGRPMKAEAVAEAQGLPLRSTEHVLVELRRAGVVRSHRGASGGFSLDRPAAEITIAEVIRAVDGPLAEVRGMPPEDTDYDGVATRLQDVWVATRTALRSVLEATTIADLVTGTLPEHVQRLAAEPTSWSTRRTRPGVRQSPSPGPPPRLR